MKLVTAYSRVWMWARSTLIEWQRGKCKENEEKSPKNTAFYEYNSIAGVALQIQLYLALFTWKGVVYAAYILLCSI